MNFSVLAMGARFVIGQEQLGEAAIAEPGNRRGVGKAGALNTKCDALPSLGKPLSVAPGLSCRHDQILDWSRTRRNDEDRVTAGQRRKRSIASGASPSACLVPGGRAPQCGPFATGRFRLRASPRLSRRAGSVLETCQQLCPHRWSCAACRRRSRLLDGEGFFGPCSHPLNDSGQCQDGACYDVSRSMCPRNLPLNRQGLNSESPLATHAAIAIHAAILKAKSLAITRRAIDE